jgi:hypothetical protein
MSLLTYEDARPWARHEAAHRTARQGRRDAAVVHREEHRHSALQERSVAAATKRSPRSRSGPTPARRAATSPTCRRPALPGRRRWHAGEPDLVVESPEITVKANTPDWWGEFEPTKIPLTEDRYVASVENSRSERLSKERRAATRWAALRVAPPDLGRPVNSTAAIRSMRRSRRRRRAGPVHEVGRNADVFEPNAGRLLKANSSIIYQSAHLHAGGATSKSKLLFGFRFHPKGYKPARRSTLRNLGNGLDIDIKPNEANQQLHAYMVLAAADEDRDLRTALARARPAHVPRGIWGINIQTSDLRRLRSQLGAPVRIRR